MISFASSYKCGFRLEVPVWYDVKEGLSLTDVGRPSAIHPPMAKPAGGGQNQGEAEEETYLVPVGYGCFSFQRGLLRRAARTMRSAV